MTSGTHQDHYGRCGIRLLNVHYFRCQGCLLKVRLTSATYPSVTFLFLPSTSTNLVHLSSVRPPGPVLDLLTFDPGIRTFASRAIHISCVASVLNSELQAPVRRFPQGLVVLPAVNLNFGPKDLYCPPFTSRYRTWNWSLLFSTLPVLG